MSQNQPKPINFCHSSKKDGRILKRIEKGRIEAQNKNDMSIFKEQSIQQVVCCKCIELGKKEHKSREEKHVNKTHEKKFFCASKD